MNFDTQTSPITKARNYITPDMVEMIASMSKEDMRKSLVELSGSHMWVAILKYLLERTSYAQSSLFTLDPFKAPTDMARLQGIVTGMTDLPDMVYSLLSKSEVPQEKEE